MKYKDTEPEILKMAVQQVITSWTELKGVSGTEKAVKFGELKLSVKFLNKILNGDSNE